MSMDLSRADQVVRQGLGDGAYTAACLLAGRGQRVFARRAYGRLSVEADALAADPHTRFDLDALSAPLVTGMLALRAMEAGKLCLQDRLDTFLHAPSDKAEITLFQLLTHTSGLQADMRLSAMAASAQDAAQAILAAPLACAPGKQARYSDAGLILLGQLLECLYDQPLNDLAVQEIFWPLGMRHTSFAPAPGNIAATEMQDDGRCLQGAAFDENARFLGGICGSAGVFSTADDLALWMQMIAANGVLPDGSRYLCPASVRLMLQTCAHGRALAFDRPGGCGFAGDLFPPETVGHAGFTGCSAAFDPASGLYLVFLTNSACPSRENPAIHRIRPLLHNAVYAACCAQ